nr:cytochrome c oxidase copper chaperone 1 isoform X2 [Tanacetum cinerariifolium]
MSGLQTQDLSSALGLTKASTYQTPAVTASSETKPKKKICCACPDTKKLRDECVVEHGESACSKWIEAHRLCLRSEGFNESKSVHLLPMIFGIICVYSDCLQETADGAAAVHYLIHNSVLLWENESSKEFSAVRRCNTTKLEHFIVLQL